MTLNGIDLKSLFARSSLGPFDPLRLLTSGSTINVEVALNPQTNSLGIKFNGVFYPAQLPSDKKRGQFLKVLLQANADQIILKLLDELPKTVQRDNKEVAQPFAKPQILSKQERQVLRDIILSAKTPLPTPTLDKQELVRPNAKEIPVSSLSKKIETILTHQTKATEAVKEVVKESIKISPESRKEEKASLKPEVVLKEGNNPVTAKYSFEPVLSPSRKIAKPEELLPQQLLKTLLRPIDLQVPSKEVVQTLINNVTKQLVAQLLPLLRASVTTQEDIFKIVKHGIAKQHLEMLQLIRPAVVDQQQTAETTTVSKSLVSNEDALPAKILKSGKKVDGITNSAKTGAPETFAELKALEPLQRSLAQLALTTDSLQRLHSGSTTKKDGIYFLLPIFVGTNLQHAEGFFSFDKEKEDGERKKKPTLTKIKMTLPVLGEIIVEIFTHGQDVQLTIFVQSQEAKKHLDESQHLLRQVFIEQGINAKSVTIFVAKKELQVPEWIRSELGFAQTA